MHRLKKKKKKKTQLRGRLTLLIFVSKWVIIFLVVSKYMNLLKA